MVGIDSVGTVVAGVAHSVIVCIRLGIVQDIWTIVACVSVVVSFDATPAQAGAFALSAHATNADPVIFVKVGLVFIIYSIAVIARISVTIVVAVLLVLVRLPRTIVASIAHTVPVLVRL